MQQGIFRLRKCALPGVEAIEAHSGHVFGRHTHDAFAIGRIVDGGQRWWSGRGNVEARRGDMISSNAGEVHDGAPLGKSRSWKMLYFSPELVAGLVRDIQEDGGPEFEFKTPVFGRCRKAAAFERCYSALTEGPQDQLAAESRAILLFSGLLWRSSCDRAAPSEQMVRARDRIHADPVTTVSLADLANDAGLSRFQALRGFTKLTGLPPHAFQVQRRLETARKLISSGTGVSDAAAASGFADQSHLHRTFVRHFGITPGAYRQARR